MLYRKGGRENEDNKKDSNFTNSTDWNVDFRDD